MTKLTQTDVLKLTEEMTKTLELARQRLQMAQAEQQVEGSETPRFFLVGGRKDMVVIEAAGVFRLDVASPNKGYGFASFGKAKVAATRWNGALTAQQKAASCEVHVASRAQYLEYIVTHLQEVIPSFEDALKRLAEMRK